MQLWSIFQNDIVIVPLNYREGIFDIAVIKHLSECHFRKKITITVTEVVLIQVSFLKVDSKQK